MYDPMVAKLIVWDADREQATRRMLRALGEYEIEKLKTLIPFHRALLASEQWARGETCRDLLEDKAWLKQLAFPAPEARRGRGGGGERVEQKYDVEVSGRRFQVRVVGPPMRRRRPRGGSAGWLRGAPTAPPRAPARRPNGAHAPPPPRAEARHAPLAAAGQRVEGARQAGRRRQGGPAARDHRGDEDGERDHRPQERARSWSCRSARASRSRPAPRSRRSRAPRAESAVLRERLGAPRYQDSSDRRRRRVADDCPPAARSRASRDAGTGAHMSGHAGRSSARRC